MRLSLLLFFNQDNTIISLSVRVIFILAHYFICLYFTFDHRQKTLINFPMSINHLSFYPRIVFLLSAIIIVISRILGMEFIALIFTPFLTLTLMYDYHITVGKDQTIYFILTFCLLGDLIVMSNDFYYFISALMAYWGASILFCIALSKELEEPLINY